MVEQVRSASYPELQAADIRLRTFHDDADYFRTGFSITRFLFVRKMRYFILVNPRAFELGAPEEGLRAIIAHELGHIHRFKKRNRIRLFGLIRLVSEGFTAEFERRTDMEAIVRGYGDGLKEYRRWLYRNVPAKKLEEKRRNYFSPEEIDAIQSATRDRPEMLDYWLKNVPRSLEEIKQDRPPSTAAFFPRASGIAAEEPASDDGDFAAAQK
jgi:hypothetical protein